MFSMLLLRTILKRIMLLSSRNFYQQHELMKQNRSVRWHVTWKKTHPKIIDTITFQNTEALWDSMVKPRRKEIVHNNNTRRYRNHRHITHELQKGKTSGAQYYSKGAEIVHILISLGTAFHALFLLAWVHRTFSWTYLPQQLSHQQAVDRMVRTDDHHPCKKHWNEVK